MTVTSDQIEWKHDHNDGPGWFDGKVVDGTTWPDGNGEPTNVLGSMEFVGPWSSPMGLGWNWWPAEHVPLGLVSDEQIRESFARFVRTFTISMGT